MKKQLVNLLPEYEELLTKYDTYFDYADMETYQQYYHLYEYTDEICVLDDNPIYPGLTNYVKTGLLTKEDVIKALLYDPESHNVLVEP